MPGVDEVQAEVVRVPELVIAHVRRDERVTSRRHRLQHLVGAAPAAHGNAADGLSAVHIPQTRTAEGLPDMCEEFRERLEIDTLAQRYDPDKLEELLDNIVEMYCCPRQTQYVGKQPQTTKAIRLRLDKLTSQHVEYIFDVMSNTTQPIKNIMAYLRTTILNAPTTMEHYYQAQGNWLTAQSRKK